MIAVTGANGHLGQRLLGVLAASGGARALVRSAAAAASVAQLELPGVETLVVDYGDVDALAAALADCSAVVHLVGIIKENPGTSYRAAHEASCRALVAAAGRAGVGHLVYLSILGARADAANPCLASKGAAEDILRAGPLPATVIQVPMVLGEGDFASAALARRAHRRCNPVLRAESLEQPIYAGDVIAAIGAALSRGGPDEHLELAGPESLSRRALTHRAAAAVGRRTRVVSLPLALGMALAAAFEAISSHPPVTRAMLGVLDHDDQVDPLPAARTLGLALTPLDQTLRACLRGPGR